MTSDEGAMRLVFHAQPNSGAFLDMLRPYRGLQMPVLQDVMRALRAAAPRLSKDSLERELLSAVWALSYYCRLWALEPRGMLRRNNLIDEADLQKLARFIEGFDYAVMTLLEKGEISEAFSQSSV
jgi:hypothetical protein